MYTNDSEELAVSVYRLQTLAGIQQITCCHIPEDRDSLKPHIFILNVEAHMPSSCSAEKRANRVFRNVSEIARRYMQGGPGSSVGISTGYGLDGPGIESR